MLKNIKEDYLNIGYNAESEAAI